MNKCPFLNILVPDWEWLGAFSVNKWDTSSDNVFVGMDDKSLSHVLYKDGEEAERVEEGMIPDFPVIIVKDNERMILRNPETRAELPQYDFADEAFNNIQSRVTAEISYPQFPVNPGSDIVSKTDFSLMAKGVEDAWREYGLDVQGAQRRYVYFGCKKGENEGTFNPKVRESIIAVKLSDLNCIDDKDPDLRELSRKSNDYSDEELLSRIWSDGSLEIQFHASVVNDKGEAVTIYDNSLSVLPSSLFDISRIRRKFYHKTAFSRAQYIYIPSRNDLVPKWYYLPEPLTFDRWIPSEQSDVITVHVYEFDKSSEVSVSETIADRKGISSSLSVGGKTIFDFNFSTSETTTVKNYTITEGSDKLGYAKVYFDDYLIKGETSDGYRLESYFTGKVHFITVPLSN